MTDGLSNMPAQSSGRAPHLASGHLLPFGALMAGGRREKGSYGAAALCPAQLGRKRIYYLK